MQVKDKLLFLKYAWPCGAVSVRRGDMTQEYYDELKQRILKNENLTQDDCDHFKVAMAMCTIAAKHLGKQEIDSKVIRHYYSKMHDQAIEERYELMGDFDKEACKVHFATYSESSNYKKDFCPDIKEGDSVAVHYNYIVDKINSEQ
jgi:uncharacterized protein YcaQ